MGLWISFWITLLTPLCLGVSHRQDRKNAGGDDALWSIDLRSVGFTGFAPKKETWGLHLGPDPVCFADNQTVIATFLTREQVTGLARRDEAIEHSPMRLHAIFFDSQTGNIRATKDWPLRRPHAGIIAVGDGKFAVLTPSLIALYSLSLELLKDLRLSSQQESQLWDFRASPSGKSVVAEYHAPKAYFQWIDMNTLLPRPISIPTVVFSISDEDVVVKRDSYVKPEGFQTDVLIRNADGVWRSVCSVLNGTNSTCGGTVQFLNNGTLGLVTPHAFSLVPKAGGAPLLQASFRNDEWLDRPLSPLVEGRRFAVTVWAHHGGSAFFDVDSRSIPKRIEIYDLPNPHPVYAVNAKQQKISGVSGIALSPDGSLFSILTNGFVRMYKLPDVTPNAQTLSNPH